MLTSVDTHYGLIVLIELAGCYKKRKLTASDISEKNHIPHKILKSVIEKLICLGFVSKAKQSKTLSLKRSPRKISIFEVVLAFESNTFSEALMDKNSNILQPKSNLAKMFCAEREKILNSIKNQLTRIHLQHWYEKAEKTVYL